jgi:hypothetical protein
VSDFTCPKCGARQDGGSECLGCGIIFDRVRPPRRSTADSQAPADSGPPGGSASPAEVEGPTPPASVLGALRRFYRVFRWVALVVLGGTLILILWTAPPPKVAIDPDAPQRLERKLQRFESDTRLGLSRPLRLDEAEVNSWMRTNLDLAAERAPATGSAPPAPTIDLNAPTDLTVEEARSNVRDVKVHMSDDRITAYVLFNLYGKDLSLTLEGRLAVRDGYLRLSPTRLMLGSLPIPQATVDRAVASLFDSPQNRDRFRLPPDIRGLSVENGELVVTWH